MIKTDWNELVSRQNAVWTYWSLLLTVCVCCYVYIPLQQLSEQLSLAYFFVVLILRWAKNNYVMMVMIMMDRSETWLTAVVFFHLYFSQKAYFSMFTNNINNS